MYQLKSFYKNEVRARLKEKLQLKNPMLLPKLEKIVISVGAGDYAKDSKVMQNIADTISLIAGQRAVITLAKKSVAGFKMREGMPMGVKVTLRNNQMYNFLEKLIVIALPRVRDFRGVPRNGFDGRGNYSFGLNEQLMFPEVVYDDIMVTHGMNITIVTTAQTDKEAFQLLEALGPHFAKGRTNG
ncbi:MAG: 50S ribosomal protein L5 [Helicobacter sp.]|nr:50S ribosomal protein L5 [Helicobacter sp.]